MYVTQLPLAAHGCVALAERLATESELKTAVCKFCHHGHKQVQCGCYADHMCCYVTETRPADTNERVVVASKVFAHVACVEHDLLLSVRCVMSPCCLTNVTLEPHWMFPGRFYRANNGTYCTGTGSNSWLHLLFLRAPTRQLALFRV